MRGLDRNEWKVLHWQGPQSHNEEYPRFYHPACYRLIARGLVYVEVCDRGHKHLIQEILLRKLPLFCRQADFRCASETLMSR
jgi:glutamyl/glutaminyl-tRNA synthetase